MYEFIQRHIRILLVLGIIIIAIMIVVLVMVSTRNNNTNNVVSVNNESNYGFLKSDISDQDKYLMLLGKIQAENFGTYSADDPRALWDLKNQSTEKFQTQVGIIIGSISASTNINTEVDPDSISIKMTSDITADVFMEGTQTTGSNITKVKSKVSLIKQGDFWLVDNIITTKL